MDSTDLANGPRAPRPAIRVRLTGAVDVVFFSCFSVLVAPFVAGVASLPIAALVNGLLHQRGPATFALTYLALFVLSTALLMWRTVFTYVEVGADGIVVRRRFRREFIPFERLVGMKTRWGINGSELAELALSDDTARSFRIDTLPALRRKALLARITEELQAYRQARRDEAALATLDRGERSVKDWREALSKARSRSEDYRQEPLLMSEVLHTLHNDAAPIDRRIGAAMTLVDAKTPEAGARIRIAAETSADPKLRVALTSIVSDDADEDAIEEATGGPRARSVARSSSPDSS
jgi:hypothetical protein